MRLQSASVNKHFYVSWMAPYYYRVIPRLGWNSKAASKKEGILRFELHHGTVGRKKLASFPPQCVIEQSNLIPRVFSLSYRRHIGKREDPGDEVRNKAFLSHGHQRCKFIGIKESETSTTTGIVWNTNMAAGSFIVWDTNMAYVEGANGGTIFSVNY